MFSLNCHIIVIVFIKEQTCFIVISYSLSAHLDNRCKFSGATVCVFAADDNIACNLCIPESLSHRFDGYALAADTVSAICWILYGQCTGKDFFGNRILCFSFCHRKTYRIGAEFTSTHQFVGSYRCSTCFYTCHMTGAIYTYSLRIAADIDHLAGCLSAAADRHIFIAADRHFTVLHITDVYVSVYTLIINIV